MRRKRSERRVQGHVDFALEKDKGSISWRWYSVDPGVDKRWEGNALDGATVGVLGSIKDFINDSNHLINQHLMALTHSDTIRIVFFDDWDRRFQPVSFICLWRAERSQKSVYNHGQRSENSINHVRRWAFRYLKVILETRGLLCGSKDKNPPPAHFWQVHYIILVSLSPVLMGLQQRIETNRHFGAAESCIVQRKYSWWVLIYNLFLI